MKPAEIRRVRTRLRFSQPEFAEFLGTRGGTLRSWEQGSPQTTKFGTPTISHCERKTGVTPTKTRLTSELSSVAGPTLSEFFDKGKS
jgi:transcriptional regulator with XRE-family HTH domain